MIRKVTYKMRIFDANGDVVRGVLEQEGGGHLCYWHAPKDVVPKKGEKHQLWMHGDGDYFSLAGFHRQRDANGCATWLEVCDAVGND